MFHEEYLEAFPFKDVDGDLADLFTAGGLFIVKLRQFLADGQMNIVERIAINELARKIVTELNQVLDAPQA